MRISTSRALMGVVAAACCLAAASCSSNTPATNPSATVDTPSASATTPDATPSPTASTPPVTLADLSTITVSGDFNTQPTVNAPYPFDVASTMCQTLIQGDGVTLTDTSLLEVQYTGINASTGDVFDTSFSSGQPMLGQNGYFVTGFNTCLTGQKVGSRVLMAITGADGYDSQGGQPDVGINVGDTLLFVVDILEGEFPGPTGQHMADGNQWVTVADNAGVPTATVNAGVPAPTSLQATVLTQGTGDPVTADDVIYVNFLTMDYSTGQIIEDSYTDGGGPQYDQLSNLIPGWRQALVGMPMGSRVLLIVPGSLAYPQGNATPSISPNATLVCVVDILFSFIPQSS